MAQRPNKTGRDDRSEHWTKLVRTMMQTPAWRALSPKAQALYPWLKFEWHGPKANNNGKIQFSCRQAAKAMGISANTAMLAFRELQEKGFIVVTKLGALGVEGEARGPSYELTELPLPRSEKPTGRRLFEKWRDGKDFEVANHQVNNPSGLNGRKNPSQELRRPCLKSRDVCDEPVLKTKTPCLENRDVRGAKSDTTVINLETSLVTRPRVKEVLPILTIPVDREDCTLKRLRAG